MNSCYFGLFIISLAFCRLFKLMSFNQIAYARAPHKPVYFIVEVNVYLGSYHHADHAEVHKHHDYGKLGKSLIYRESVEVRYINRNSEQPL